MHEAVIIFICFIYGFTIQKNIYCAIVYVFISKAYTSLCNGCFRMFCASVNFLKANISSKELGLGTSGGIMADT